MKINSKKVHYGFFQKFWKIDIKMNDNILKQVPKLK